MAMIFQSKLIQKKSKKNSKKNHILIIAVLVLFSFLQTRQLYAPADKMFSKIEAKIPTEVSKTVFKTIKKRHTHIYYLAGVNNLGYFLRKNLTQLSEIGSSQHINIVVQLDVLLPDNKKVTKRYYVEKNKLIILNHNDPETQSMDSGDPKTLINWCKYCIEHYPAENYSLILSNHATGIIEIGQVRAINPSELFTFNPTTNMIELNRSLPFLEFISTPDNQRGICFDDITGHYITNQKLEQALKIVCNNYIKGKFQTIIFDACLQQMYEIAILLKPYARFMLGSQEVILAPGLDYHDVLKPFEQQMADPVAFVKHIVKSYENTYKNITHDYTFSALDLSVVAFLENNVTVVANLLTECLKNQRGSIVYEAIKTSRHKLLCTHFEEPSYIDIGHFFKNLRTNLERAQSKIDKNNTSIKTLVANLIGELNKGLSMIKNTIVAHVAGKNLNQSTGLSIYFPEFGAKHPSYNYNHAWSIFLDYYLQYK